MDHGLPGSSVHGDPLGKNLGVACHFLLQGIFITQGFLEILGNLRMVQFLMFVFSLLFLEGCFLPCFIMLDCEFMFG